MRPAKFKCPKCGSNYAAEVTEGVTSYTEFNEIDIDSLDTSGVLEWFDNDFDCDDSFTVGYECNHCGFWLGDTFPEIKQYFTEEK